MRRRPPGGGTRQDNVVRKPDYTRACVADTARSTPTHADELVVLVVRAAKALVDRLRAEHPDGGALADDRRARPRGALPPRPRRRHRRRARALPRHHEAVDVRGRRPARTGRHRAPRAASARRPRARAAPHRRGGREARRRAVALAGARRRMGRARRPRPPRRRARRAAWRISTPTSPARVRTRTWPTAD